jgi:hypothetical protein
MGIVVSLPPRTNPRQLPSATLRHETRISPLDELDFESVDVDPRCPLQGEPIELVSSYSPRTVGSSYRSRVGHGSGPVGHQTALRWADQSGSVCGSKAHCLNKLQRHSQRSWVWTHGARGNSRSAAQWRPVHHHLSKVSEARRIVLHAVDVHTKGL